MMYPRKKGFTLAELLIALAILGVIAAFTIPKVLNSTGTAQFKSIAKETAGIISEGLQSYAVNYPVTSTVTPLNILANLNYVTIPADASATAALTGLPENCVSGTVNCYQLHNGALLQVENDDTFGGSATTNYIGFNLDPDGTKGTATTDIVTFALMYNGRMVSNKDTITGATSATPLTLNTSTTNPSWFVWTP